MFSRSRNRLSNSERTDTAAAFAATAGGHHVRRDANAFSPMTFKRLNQRDTLSAKRVDLFAISDALRLTHQTNLLSFGAAGLLDVVGLALAFRLALLGAFARDLDADRRGHQIFLIVGVRLVFSS